jgi:Domain of unknown function (DUF4158)
MPFLGIIVGFNQTKLMCTIRSFYEWKIIAQALGKKMSRIIILAAEEQQFEQPPSFTNKQRRTFFALPDALQKVLSRLQTEPNKIFFLVQLAYFKACQQFFDPNDFLDKDITYAAQLLGFYNISRKDVSAYRITRTALNHQKGILDFLGYRAYDDTIRKWLILEIKELVERQVSPKKIFLTILKLLQERSGLLHERFLIEA